MEQPDSLDELNLAALAAKKRTKWLGGAVVAAIGAAAVFAFSQQDDDLTALVTPAWSQLSHCLTGAPLSVGESAQSRLRSVELAFTNLPKNSPNLSWPDHCQKAAYRVSQAIDTARLKEGGRLSKTAGDLATALGRKPKAHTLSE